MDERSRGLLDAAVREQFDAHGRVLPPWRAYPQIERSTIPRHWVSPVHQIVNGGAHSTGGMPGREQDDGPRVGGRGMTPCPPFLVGRQKWMKLAVLPLLAWAMSSRRPFQVRVEVVPRTSRRRATLPNGCARAVVR